LHDKDAVTSVRVDPFAGGGVEYTTTAAIVTAGEGVLTASYEGGAAGIYVRTITNDNDDTEATGWGEFTADASFTAKFGTAKDTLSGMIDGFERVTGTGDGTEPMDSWELEYSGDIEDGKVNKANEFHAIFQGEDNGKTQSNGHKYAPYGLVGTFQSGDQISNGQITGAFGTECRGSNCVKQN